MLETIRCGHGAAPLLERHQERLERSWKPWFRGRPPALAEIAGKELREDRGTADLVRVAFLRVGGSSRPQVQVEVRALPASPRRIGVAIAASARREAAADRALKSVDRRWVDELAVEGVFETLVWDDENGLLEGTRSNLFLMQGKELITPPVSCGLVPGVVRAALLASAATFGLRAIERVIRPEDVARADGLLLTGSGVGVVAPHECDGRGLGGRAVLALATKIEAALLGRAASPRP